LCILEIITATIFQKTKDIGKDVSNGLIFFGKISLKLTTRKPVTIVGTKSIIPNAQNSGSFLPIVYTKIQNEIEHKEKNTQ